MDEIIIKQSTAVIDANFEEIKEMLEKQMAFYSGMLFTEETEKSAKETVAQLRKQQKEIGTRIKAEKDKYMKPWNDFADKVAELTDMFNKPINVIQAQLDDFELKRKAEKRAEIEGIYAELVSEEEYQQYIPLTKIFNERWLNKTFSVNDIKAEIMDAKQNVKSALTTIKAMHSEVEPKALEVFKSNLSITEALLVITNYETQKKEVLERERERVRAAEEDRIRREERERIATEQKHEEEIKSAVEEVINTLLPAEDTEEPEEIYVYNIFLTSKAKEALEIYMNTAGITYTQRKM